MKFEKVKDWHTLYQIMKKAYEAKKKIQGYVIFTEDSFTEVYSKESRTYIFGSNNKFFNTEAMGNSLFASSLDGTDPCVRLNEYLSDWKIEECGLYESD